MSTMLPISEFHFAFCGIATVAATLGYACARRVVLSSSNESSKADVEAGTPEERSLKRKLADSDEHDADTEELSRPMKRNRTPPVDQHETDEDFIQEWEVVVAPPPPYEQVETRQDHSTPPKADSHIIEHDVVTPVREPTPPAHPETSPRPDEKGVEAGRCATPQPQVNLSPNEPETPPPRPITPSKPTAPAKIESLNAFSAFSGSSSPFSTYSNASGASPFALSGQNVKTAPAWRRNDETESDAFGRTSSANALVPSPNDTVASGRTKSSALSYRQRSLKAPSETQPLVELSSCPTGEEDETIEAELKGVKLFIKRGCKEFTDGIYGHIKILARKSTPQEIGNGNPVETEAENPSRTRLLFRRDPLGQVSMNVGLCPTVQCHFDTAENILRVVLMEQVKTDGKICKEDVVIYALKPGRSQKADFQSFAKTLCDHEGLKSRVVTGPTTPASGVAAAS